MSNVARGAFDLEVGGETYRLQFTTNAMCELEEATGESVTAFLGRFGAAAGANDVRFRDLRALFWAALTEHHEGITQRQAARIMDEAGGAEAVVRVIEKVVAAAFPAGKAASPGNRAAGADGGRAPTGPRS